MSYDNKLVETNVNSSSVKRNIYEKYDDSAIIPEYSMIL